MYTTEILLKMMDTVAAIEVAGKRNEEERSTDGELKEKTEALVTKEGETSNRESNPSKKE